MKIELSPEALAALNAEGAELKAPPKPLNPMGVHACRRAVARAVFGPTMKPTFKQQLLAFPSYAAVKAVWAADHFQKVQTAKRIIEGLKT